MSNTSEEIEEDPLYGGQVKPVDADLAWIGVDFLGTLAEDQVEGGGRPIESMRRRVKDWLSQGKRVKICSKHAGDPEVYADIQAWLHRHNLPNLEITRTLDEYMTEYWSHRVKQVVRNDGRTIKEYIQQLR